MFKPNKHEEEQKKTQTKKKNIIILYLINDKEEKMKMCGFTSSCTCAKYHPGRCSPFIHFVVSNDSVSGQ